MGSFLPDTVLCFPESALIARRNFKLYRKKLITRFLERHLIGKVQGKQCPILTIGKVKNIDANKTASLDLQI